MHSDKAVEGVVQIIMTEIRPWMMLYNDNHVASMFAFHNELDAYSLPPKISDKTRRTHIRQSLSTSSIIWDASILHVRYSIGKEKLDTFMHNSVHQERANICMNKIW